MAREHLGLITVVLVVYLLDQIQASHTGRDTEMAREHLGLITVVLVVYLLDHIQGGTEKAWTDNNSSLSRPDSSLLSELLSEFGIKSINEISQEDNEFRISCRSRGHTRGFCILQDYCCNHNGTCCSSFTTPITETKKKSPDEDRPDYVAVGMSTAILAALIVVTIVYSHAMAKVLEQEEEEAGFRDDELPVPLSDDNCVVF